MSLDQIWARLCDIENLKRDVGVRSKQMSTLETAINFADKDGLIRGRAADGTPMTAIIRGKSKARELMEIEEAKQEKARQRKKRRRRKRGI